MRPDRLFRKIQSSIQMLFPVRVAGISKVALGCVLALGISGQNSAKAQASEQAAETPSRIVESIDDAKLVRLIGNTHPLARPEYDVGRVDPDLPMDRMLLVLQRSPEQDAALDRFMAEQYNPESGNFHHWLTAREFGLKYGPSDADLAKVTAWLQVWGFSVEKVGKGRTFIEFSGTATQVEQAFHVEMHRYLVDGVEHIANDRDPQIPEALTPVITGIASLQNFFPKPLSVFGDVVKRNKKTGKVTVLDSAWSGAAPQFVFTDSSGVVHEDVTPFDFAAIYNIRPLWDVGITGKGVTIAISGGGDIEQSDVALFRSAFGLPANPVKVIHNGTDPGLTYYQLENTLDVEWSGATAPDATIALVVSADTSTMLGSERSDLYIVEEGVAPIMSASYGDCELHLGTAGNSMFNKIWQQGAAEGISIFESAGDQGSTGCDAGAVPPAAAEYGLQVNGMASSPFVTAVGGTDLDWQGNRGTYWNASNNGLGANAKGYIPEIPWNPTCGSTFLVSLLGYPSGEAFCNAIWPDLPNLYPFVTVAGGSGGVSACTTPSGTTPASCAGGYAKPAWQTGTGVPNDGKRDLPDISLFASSGYSDIIPGSAYLFCYSSVTPGLVGTCHNGGDSTFLQEIGGTSASSPAMAGIMALVLQKTGAIQGLANPVLYALAAKENLTTCNSSTVANGNSCVFYDITKGDNNQVCGTGKPNCVTHTSGDFLGVVSGYGTNRGYDLATGLGSINVTNLVDAWASAIGKVTLTPTSLTFPSTKEGVRSAAQVVTLKNTGGGALALWAMQLTGTDHSSFSGTTTCPVASTRLGAGDSCTISITFTPAATGTLTAQLNIYDNASGEKQVLKLTGTGN